MFFPLPMHPLTHAIDYEIHQFVRKAAPVKYWGFVFSRLVCQIGVWGMTAGIAFYLVIHAYFERIGQTQGPEFEQLMSSILSAVVAASISAVISGFVNSYLWEQLQNLVRQAARSISPIRAKA